VRLDGDRGPLRYRLVDDDQWRPVGEWLTIPPLSAAVVLPEVR
jgi:hypothetical protein